MGAKVDLLFELKLNNHKEILKNIDMYCQNQKRKTYFSYQPFATTSLIPSE